MDPTLVFFSMAKCLYLPNLMLLSQLVRFIQKSAFIRCTNRIQQSGKNSPKRYHEVNLLYSPPLRKKIQFQECRCGFSLPLVNCHFRLLGRGNKNSYKSRTLTCDKRLLEWVTELLFWVLSSLIIYPTEIALKCFGWRCTLTICL